MTSLPVDLTVLIRFPSTDVLSAALDSGVAIAVVIIFFCLQFPKNGSIGVNTTQGWWGNTVSFNNADGNYAPLLTPAGPTATFGYVFY